MSKIRLGDRVVPQERIFGYDSGRNNLKSKVLYKVVAFKHPSSHEGLKLQDPDGNEIPEYWNVDYFDLYEGNAFVLDDSGE